MPPLETKTDSPGETPEVPQDPCQHWRGILRFRHDSAQDLRTRQRRERDPERPGSNSSGDLPLLRPPERVPEVPVVSQEHLPQLEKIQEVLPSRRDEAQFHLGVSRQITSNIWNFQRVLHTVAATQEVPRHTRLHSRGSTRVPPTSRGAPFPPPSSRGGILPLRGRDRIPSVPSHLKRWRSPQEGREELQGRDTIPRVPQMPQSIPGKTVFPELPRLSSRGSSHNTVARGTALWESIVGKPSGKASRESHRSLDPGEGSVTLLLQLGWKGHVYAPTRNRD